MHKYIGKGLRFFLVFWGIYLVSDGLLYFFNIRLADIKGVWPASSIVYSQLVGKVLGSAFLLIAFLAFELQGNLLKYKKLIKLSGFWALFHGGLLIFLSLSDNYLEVFKNSPSLYAWIPFYNQYLALEGIVVIFYSILVYLWLKQTK